MGGRYLIYVPEFADHTVLFFYAKNPTSFSVRDYTTTPVTTRYRADLGAHLTADDILELARRPVGSLTGAEVHDTTDLEYWRDVVARRNAKLGLPPPGPTPPRVEPSIVEYAFSLLDEDVFASLPKSRKTQDVGRMRNSPNSEDWVTWTITRLMARQEPSTWWPSLLGVARGQIGSDLELPPPTGVHPWVRVNTPIGYERALRLRMAGDPDNQVALRAQHPDSVEGDSEIDLVLTGDGYTIYIEAKLGSDISGFTKHDTERNQIVRNIDCVLEHGTGAPLFWMFVKDRHPARQYTRVIDGYRADPGGLYRLLGHRDPAQLADLIANTAVITWSEVLDALVVDDAELADVVDEVRRRIT